MQKLHGGDIVDVDLGLEDYNQSFPVHLDGQHRGRKDQLAYRALALSSAHPQEAYLCIDDLQLSRGVGGLGFGCPDKCDKTRTEEHLNDAGRTLVG